MLRSSVAQKRRYFWIPQN